MDRKGIILAGGTGSRLHPSTKAVSKQLMPIFDKPMVYYPLSTLISAGIRNILLIVTSHDLNAFQSLLGSGSKMGINISYAIQDTPGGIAEALLIAEDFLNKSPSVLILGDNIFIGNNFSKTLKKIKNSKGATIFAYYVEDPERYGIIEFNGDMTPKQITEKPKKPKSNYAISGLYFYDNSAPSIAKGLKPSKRGELEITDLNKAYLTNQTLSVEILDSGFAWMDTGTTDSMLQSSQYIASLQKRSGMLVGSPEIESFLNGWISTSELRKIARTFKNDYGNLLLKKSKQIR